MKLSFSCQWAEEEEESECRLRVGNESTIRISTMDIHFGKYSRAYSLQSSH